MSDLLYAVRWRYTQVGRKKILKVKKYSKIRNIKSKKCIINNRTINEWQQDPRNHNKTSLNIYKFTEYLK